MINIAEAGAEEKVMREKLKKARTDAGMTQQEMADYLDINIRHYQKIEAGETSGSFEAWDALEDLLGIHQRKLREISNSHPVQGESRSVHPKNQQGQ